MRLLKKDEISKAQGLEKSREINEGLKISRRVDGLRELQAKEEENLEKFRKETLASIMQDIKNAEIQKDSLLLEMNSLREEKSKGMREIELERQEILSLKSNIEIRENSLNERIKDILLRENEIETNLAISRSEIEKSRIKLSEVDELHESAFKIREEAISTLEEIRKNEEEDLKVRREAQNEISLRWNEIYKREENLSTAESILSEKLDKIKTGEFRISSLEESLRIKEEKLLNKTQELDFKEEEISKNLQDSRDELDRATAHKEETIKLRHSMGEDNKKLQEIIQNSREIERDINEKKDKIEKELTERENSVNSREKDLLVRQEENEKISQELENRAIRLADRTKVREKILQTLQ